MSMNLMVRGIKVKTRRMGTKPELELTLLFLSVKVRRAVSLTILIILCWSLGGSLMT